MKFIFPSNSLLSSIAALSIEKCMSENIFIKNDKLKSFGRSYSINYFSKMYLDGLGIWTNLNKNKITPYKQIDIYQNKKKTIQFNSSESSTNQPEIEITYTWTQNDSVIQPSLESPINGEPVWNLTGHNLSGNQTPSLKWNETNNPDHGIIYQLSNDSLFRSIIVENDARTQQNINSSMGEIQVSSNSPLEKGKKYYWRVAHLFFIIIIVIKCKTRLFIWQPYQIIFQVN